MPLPGAHDASMSALPPASFDPLDAIARLRRMQDRVRRLSLRPRLAGQRPVDPRHLSEFLGQELGIGGTQVFPKRGQVADGCQRVALIER